MNSTLWLLVGILSSAPAHSQTASATRFDASPAALPRLILGDVARLARPLPLAVLGMGAAIGGAVHPADARVVRSLSSSSPAETALDAGATLGGGGVQFGIAGAVYLSGMATHHQGAAALGSALLQAQTVEGLTAQALKHAVGRSRPDGGRYSFPSGHTSSAFATADILLQRFGWRAGAAAYAAAAYVAASRLSERQHYPSDVVFGAALGIASARTVQHARRTTSLQVSPVALHHGAAVLVSITGRP